MRRMQGWRACAVAAALCAWVSGCARGKEYPLQGQILAVDAAQHQLTIKHDDIRGYMPAMTMPFKVRDDRLLAGRTPGELIRATLVIEETEGYLKDIEVTGTAPLAEKPPPPFIAPMEPGALVPDVTLVDDTGQTRHLSDWSGHPVALTFIYTRCPLPDFCPLVDRQFAQVQRDVIADPRLKDRVRLISISFDPAFDTPAVLAAHATKVGADPKVWGFLTGDRADIEAFAGRFGVSIMREDPKATEVVHNLRTAVIDGNRRLVKMFNGVQWQPSELVDALRHVVDGR